MGFMGMISSTWPVCKPSGHPGMLQLSHVYQMLVRDLAASICALMLATRVGAELRPDRPMVVTNKSTSECAPDPVDTSFGRGSSRVSR
jgi:hypothetical protein